MAWDYSDQAVEQQKKADPVWFLERQINLEIGGKIDPKLLEKHLPQLNIPDERRALLELFLWNKPF